MSKENLKQKLVEPLALKFSQLIHRDLTPTQLLVVIANNRASNDDTCATGDMIDSNMTMGEAFEAIVGREEMSDSEADIGLWNAAWDLAKKNHFKLEVLP